jgi:ribosomal protein S18 acetylase RimI-like enzyme
MVIRPFRRDDEKQVIALWEHCGLVKPQNNPQLDIARKLAVGADLFFVGERDGAIVATAMGGYEGHRGWVNYLAVDPELRGQQLGRAMMEALEQRLLALGCPKLNLQIRSTNSDVIAFYRALGYSPDPVTSLGKRLIKD